ncbi:hypothetical protein CI109_106064 [Kwoniella shandongensis]|uniref:Mediator of RNA polymerase II transcription subunit 12 n=1 Tax=Kwoniella shandongensis TaxID=1734106 RepID=A0AAJ8MZL1_9TREE
MPTTHRYPPGVNPYAPSASSSTSSNRTQQQVKAGRSSFSRPPTGGGGTHHGHHHHPPKVLLEDADIEDFAPPEWRTVLNTRADLGFPDFYPSRPGFDQPEDVLTEENVKNGFSGKSFVAVGAEVFSMHGPIHQHLTSGGLNMLMQLGKEVIEKRQDTMPQIGERSFRIPVRVTYNDTKRLQFLSDLANPNVPLHRLMRTPVPHGFKGVELLDTMFSPAAGSAVGHNRTPSGGAKIPSDPIPIDRALWFIRVLGANEITAHRSRTTQPAVTQVQAPSPAAATPSSTTTVTVAPTLPVSSNDWYTQEFTNIFISWLRMQLTQLALPNTNKAAASKPGVPPVKTGTGVLADEKSRTRWLSKWDYSTRLMRELHTRHLLSSRLLSGWMADYLSHTNLAQLGFLAQLIGEYLQDMTNHQCNARHCVKAACEKLKEIRASPAASTLTKVEALLVSIIKSLYEANPEVLLSPSTFKLHSETLATILPTSSRVWENLRHRNERLLFKPAITERSSSPRRQQMEEIQKLDSINEDTNMAELTRSYFDGASSATTNTLDMVKLEEKVFILINWAMGLFQLGSHRPYAVYTLLKHWHEQHEQHQSKQARPQVIDLFYLLYKWLDTSAAAHKEENAQAIGITFGELIRRGLFSYGRYLQSLIAKGQTARSVRPGQGKSHHLALLRVMPIFVEAKDLTQQRRIALCGDDAGLRAREDVEEEEVIQSFKEEVQEYVPEIFGYTLRDSVDYQMPSTSQMTRYLYVRARFWIAPAATARLKRQGRTPAMDSSTFARFLLRALQDSEDDGILDIIIDILRRDADVWTAMDMWSRFGDKLLDRYHSIEKKGEEHPRLLLLLKTLAQKGRLTPDEEDEVKHLPSNTAKSPIAEAFGKVDIKESIPSLQQALVAGREEIAMALASKLYTRHGPFSAWGSTWWTTIIDTVLRSGAAEPQSSTLIRTVVEHVEAVNAQAGAILNPVVATWLESFAPHSLVDLLGKRHGVMLTTILLELVGSRHLSTVILLERIAFPLWKYASAIALSPRKRLAGKQIHAVMVSIDIASQLLVTPPLVRTLPPTSLAQALVIQASRQAVYQTPDVQLLIQHLPLLVVLEKSALLPETSTTQISDLLRCLAMTAEFKTAAFRNLNILKDAFLSTEWSRPGMDPALEAGMVDTLKLIMSEKAPGSSGGSSKIRLPTFDTSARFSAWRWTRIVLEMRVEFKGLATRIANQDDVADAKQTLNKLVHATLDRDTTADDTDLLCEAFRGMDSVVTQEILAAGMERLASLLSGAISAETQHQLEAATKSIDQVLRILDSTNHQPTAPISDHSVLNARHKLLDLLALSLQSVERQMSTDADMILHDDISPPEPAHLLKTVLNLLRFTLGIATTDTLSPTMPKPNFPHLAVCCFKIILACHETLDGDSSQMMCDMLAYIIDTCQVALLGETTPPSVQAILAASPHLATPLPYLTPVRRNMSLLGPHVVDDGSVEAALSLDDRHWELFEYMAPPPRKIKHQDLYLASTSIKDSSSIPMTLFDPKITRDAIPGLAEEYAVHPSNDATVTADEAIAFDDDSDLPWEEYASERNLGDGFAGEPTYARQMITSMFSAGDDQAEDQDVHMAGVTNTADLSPVSSGRPRRASTRIAHHGNNGLPVGLGIGLGLPMAKGSGSNKDPIAIEDDEGDDDDSDDGSEEIVTAPPASKRPRTASKSTASGGASGRSTTGGKAPAKRTSTTSGKTVSRKVTGGKGVRGGKAPKGGAGAGRRKSVAD